MNCFKCQNEIPDSSKFCKYCGQNLLEQAQPEVEEPALIYQEQEPPQEQFQQNYEENQTQNYQEQEYNQSPNYQEPQYNHSENYQTPSQENTNYQSYNPNTNYQQDQNFIPEETPVPPPKKGLPSFLNAKNIAIAGITAAVVAAVIIIVPKLATSPEAVVQESFGNTTDAIQAEIESITEQIPAYTFFEDFDTESYKFSANYSGANVDLYSNIKDNEYRIDVNAMGMFDASMLLSSDYLTIESSLIGDVYGVDFKTAAEDLQANNFLSAMGVVIPAEYFELMPASTLDFSGVSEELSAISDLVVSHIVANSEIEEVADRELIVKGEEKDVKTYALTMSGDDFYYALSDAIDEFFDNNSSIEDIESYLDTLNSLHESLVMVDGYGLGFDEEMDVEALKDLLKVYANDISYDFEEISSEPILISIEDGIIANIEFTDYYGDAIILSLSEGDTILESMYLETYYGRTSISVILQDEYFVFEYDDGYTLQYLDYDLRESKDNLIFYNGSYETILSVDTTEKDVVKFAYDDGYSSMEVVAEKTDFDFEQGDFVNLFQMSETEFYALISEIQGNGNVVPFL